MYVTDWWNFIIYIYIYIYKYIRGGVGVKMCKWLSKTPIYKFNTFYFFNLREKFVGKQKLQSLFYKMILVRTWMLFQYLHDKKEKFMHSM